jgi:hypothetical protein
MPSEYQKIAELLRKLCEQEKHPFPQSRQPVEAPVTHGVYIIRGNDTILHVGRTPRGRYGLWQRLKEHLRGGSSFVRDYLNGQPASLREQGYTYQYLVVEGPRKRPLLEALATGKLCPAHIGTGRG